MNYRLYVIASALLGLGILFIISPVLIMFIFRGSYERYIWTISGPFPFNYFGSGPGMLFFIIILELIGLILVLTSQYTLKLSRK